MGSPRVPATSCEHEATETLGTGADAEYARCLLCGSVLVYQRGTVWLLRSVDAKSETVESREVANLLTTAMD